MNIFTWLSKIRSERMMRMEYPLAEIREKRKRVIALRDQSRTLKASLHGAAIRYDKDRVQTSPKDSMCEVMAQAIDLDREIQMLEGEIVDTIASLVNFFKELKPEEAKFAKSYYFQASTMAEAAEYAGIAERTAYRTIKRIRGKYYEIQG